MEPPEPGTESAHAAPAEPTLSRPGIAPIKAEYLSKKPEPVEGAPVGAAAEPADEKKRKRGMNKPAEREHFRAKAHGVCARHASGVPCDFGAECKFSHDLGAYLASASRPADLEGECPQMASAGFCQFGVLCRFGRSHVDPETGVNVPKPGVPPTIVTTPRGESNAACHETLKLLRVWKYPFDDALKAAADAQAATLRERSARDGTEGVAQPAAASVAAPPVASAPTAPHGAEGARGEQGAGYGCSEHALRREERKVFDVRGKLYLAPLTTVGNLPFRRLCVGLGADVTCSEMALSLKLVQGDPHEWKLLRRHESERCFGVQLAGGQSDLVAKACMAVAEQTDAHFVDLNMGCPIDAICNKGMGAMLMGRPARICELVRAASAVLRPRGLHLTVKLRMSVDDKSPVAHKIVPSLADWGASLCTLHGRSRQQRYSRQADWDYIGQCAAASSVPFIGNGDVFSHEDLAAALARPAVATVMVARGALIKPWLFTELQERRHWDISATERLELMQRFARFGLEHWGSDEIGVGRTRLFLLEWLSFACRYVPLGLLERLPPKINERAPYFTGRSDLETLLSSPRASDWVKITELLLGPVPANFYFIPKHKASASSGPITAEG